MNFKSVKCWTESRFGLSFLPQPFLMPHPNLPVLDQPKHCTGEVQKYVINFH